MVLQNGYQFVREIDAADLLGLCRDNVPVNLIDAALNNEVFSVKVQISRLQSSKFTLAQSGLNRSQKERVTAWRVFLGAGEKERHFLVCQRLDFFVLRGRLAV